MDCIALFASGSGTNAERIMDHFRSHPSIRVDLVLSNNPGAFALERARRHGVETALFSRTEFYETTRVPDLLQSRGITFVVLAGFLWLVPSPLLSAYPGRILNIHPALLPNYGGKGMYGMKVHEAVLRAGDSESGITIHHVNEQYDAGSSVFQARCPVLKGDSPETLAARIHELEHRHYPEVIENVILSLRSSQG